MSLAWDRTLGSEKVVIAVIHTGYRPHSDLVDKLLPGYDFIIDAATANDGNGRDADASDPGDWVTLQELENPGSPFYRCNLDGQGNVRPLDSGWHGTHVAGIVGTSSNNSRGSRS